MGLVYAEIELTNGDDLAFNRRGSLPENEIRRFRSRALVDSGALDLVINEDVRKQLDLPVLYQRIVSLADETLRQVDIVGPVEIRFENRQTIVAAVVLPGAGDVLLGAIPLEGLDVFIDPVRERLVVNPQSPHLATSQIKGVSLSI